MIRIGSTLFLAFLLTSCSLIIPSGIHNATVAATCDSCMGDTGQYRVNSDDYPTYQVETNIIPRNEYYMGVEPDNHLKFESKFISATTSKVRTSDIWYVKYNLGDSFIIQSPSYNERFLLADNNGEIELWVQKASELGILISPDGTIKSNLLTTKFLRWGYMTDREQRVMDFDSTQYTNNWPKSVSFAKTGS
ncbi:hypothetical protein EXT46_05740 [Pseudoalteromonas sp. CO325X]|uniref:hypothetical protein n=1 Tax=Pseudoalteromonas sp. CO325X TaxID=1777262 RepID=UPI00102375E0|nr:hypothetical protein [Pseudoalteromonas sp. CO325X]RZF82953.1 hypothetical protein EXT46_05740 [Pseudoalteromonas sp. CO325X]